jgi:hypothetical protein
MASSPTTKIKPGASRLRSVTGSIASSPAVRREKKKLPPISAEEFDRRIDAGEDMMDYCVVISEAEMEKHVRLSREGKLEAYLAKLDGIKKRMPKL